MTLYKLTDKDGGPVHGGKGKWFLPSRGKPGAWRGVGGTLVPCKNGLHLLRPADLTHWLRLPAVLWVAEAGDETVVDTDKVVVRRARLVRKVPGYTEKNVRLFAVECAEHVLPIFEERYPKDDRVRTCIKATRRYLAKKITKKQLEVARADAADAYADAAADANADAAAAAVAAAADANADAAADAVAAAAAAVADANARKAEREWQAKRLCKIIGVEYEA